MSCEKNPNERFRRYNETAPLGRLQLGRTQENPTPGLKVNLRAPHALLRSLDTRNMRNVSVDNVSMCVSRSEINLAPARYQVFSVNGISFPSADEFFPSGHGRTLIFDHFTQVTQVVRELSLLE